MSISERVGSHVGERCWVYQEKDVSDGAARQEEKKIYGRCMDSMLVGVTNGDAADRK